MVNFMSNQINTSLEEIARITGVEYTKVKRIAQLLPKPPEGGQMIYYTPEEVANLLGVHVKTIGLWYNSGKIPAVEIAPQTIRIPRRDLMLALRKMKRPAPADEGSDGE